MMLTAKSEAARRSIIKAADMFVQTLNQQGYRLPYAPGPDGKYPWGSTSFVLNNMIILALAYDFTHDAAYLNAVVNGMDYILGRNAMDKSYVSAMAPIRYKIRITASGRTNSIQAFHGCPPAHCRAGRTPACKTPMPNRWYQSAAPRRSAMSIIPTRMQRTRWRSTGTRHWRG